MFINEVTIEYDPSLAGKKVRVQPEEELCEKNLKPSFKLGRTNVGVFACIAKESGTRLILVRKRTKMERRGPRDKLGLNASQFASEMHKPHVIPFIRSLCDNPNHIYLVVDGATWHHGLENKRLQDDCGYHQLPWVPNSLDLNPIEFVVALETTFEKALLKARSSPSHCFQIVSCCRERMGCN